jgi:hypothetical protein
LNLTSKDPNNIQELAFSDNGIGHGQIKQILEFINSQGLHQRARRQGEEAGGQQDLQHKDHVGHHPHEQPAGRL